VRPPSYRQATGSLASADAFYFLASPDLRDDEGLFMTCDAPVEGLNLEDLPAEETGDHDWPVTWKQGPVLVVRGRGTEVLADSPPECLAVAAVPIDCTGKEIVGYPPF
jgi:hypothetical protein